jgi:hypothetical protein
MPGLYKGRAFRLTPSACKSGCDCGAQEVHELFVDLSRGFVLHSVAHIVDLEISDETGEASAEFFDWRIQYP